MSHSPEELAVPSPTTATAHTSTAASAAFAAAATAVVSGHPLPVPLGDFAAVLAQFLLTVPDAPAPAWSGRLDHPDQPRIHAAAQAEPLVQGVAGAAARLERVLTCLSSSGLAWSECLAPLAAPFVLHETSDLDAYTCAAGMVARLAPFAAHAADARVMAGICELLRLAVTYHDPELGLHVQQRGASFADFAPQWFESMFTRICSAAALNRLWDVFVLQSNMYQCLFVATALVLASREALLKAPDAASVLGCLRGIRLERADQVDRVLQESFALWDVSPISLRKQLGCAMRNTPNYQGWMHGYLTGALCLELSAADVEAERDQGKSVTVVDCRPRALFAQGSLPAALSLPLADAAERPALFAQTLSQLREMQSPLPSSSSALPLSSAQRCRVHYLVCGDGCADQSAMVALLLARGVRHVAAVYRGYGACHALAMAGRLELVGHAPARCEICSPPLQPIAAEVAGALRSGLLSGLGRLRAAVAAATAAPAAVASTSTTRSRPSQPTLLHRPPPAKRAAHEAEAEAEAEGRGRGSPVSTSPGESMLGEAQGQAVAAMMPAVSMQQQGALCASQHQHLFVIEEDEESDAL
eukprot:m51a1_g6144 hypothetical protein (587) ;mRNA; r:284123-287099